jgi:hypothetical protein
MSDKFSLEKELAALRALVEGGSVGAPQADSKPPRSRRLAPDEDYWPGKDIGLTREQSALVYPDRQPVEAESSEPETSGVGAQRNLKSNLDVPK